MCPMTDLDEIVERIGKSVGRDLLDPILCGERRMIRTILEDHERAVLERHKLLLNTLRLIAEDAPPDDWKSWDTAYGDYLGYGERGMPGYVADVDPTNMGDVHSHGETVGAWHAARLARAAITRAGKVR